LPGQARRLPYEAEMHRGQYNVIISASIS
jgi:hypothetical protein